MESKLTCDSRITSVEVYARGAVVTREVELPVGLPPEAVTLEIAGISPMAEPASVRTIVDGERAVTGLRAPVVHTPAKESALSEADRAKREALHQEISRQQMRLTQAKRRREAVLAINPEINFVPEDEGLSDIAVLVGNSLAAVALRTELLVKLDAEVERLQEEIKRLNAEAVKVNSAATPATADRTARSVLVALAAGSDHLRKLSITYVVPTARWWPAYSVRVEDAGKRAEVSVEAFVAQATGEDWNNVALSLCTADMLTEIKLPELPSLRLGRAQPPRARAFREPPEGLDALFDGFDRGMEPSLTLEVQAVVHEPKPMASRIEPAADYDDYREELAADYEQDEYPVIQELSSAPPAPPEMRKKASPARSRAKESIPEGMPMSAPAGPPTGSASQQIPDYDAGRMQDKAQDADDPEAWLDYDSLALAPVEDARRGRLKRAHDPAPPDAERYLSAFGLIPEPDYSRDPRESRGNYDYRYVAEGRYEVPSDGGVHRVRLMSAKGPAAMRLRCVPLEDDRVYREVELENPVGAPLLHGPVDVFMDGVLMISTALYSTDRGGMMRFGLGHEQRVSVVRNVRAREEIKGLRGGKTSVEHQVTMEIASALPAEVELELLDRVPIPGEGSKDLQIVSDVATPKAERYDQRNRAHTIEGGLRWVLKLPAGATHTVKHSYRIEFDSAYEIEGGNRRD